MILIFSKARWLSGLLSSKMCGFRSQLDSKVIISRATGQRCDPLTADCGTLAEVVKATDRLGILGLNLIEAY